MRHCASCKSEFCDTDTRCDSSIYGAQGMELCEECSDAEEHAIARNGTNDLPERLNYYKR
jgi:hypothetical protein